MDNHIWSQWTYYLLPASGQNCSNNEQQLVDCSMMKILHWELVDMLSSSVRTYKLHYSTELSLWQAYI